MAQPGVNCLMVAGTFLKLENYCVLSRRRNRAGTGAASFQHGSWAEAEGLKRRREGSVPKVHTRVLSRPHLTI